MNKQNLIRTIIITLVVNAVFVYISYLTDKAFKLSTLHIFFGILPIVLYFRKVNFTIF
jgi:uncharacterized membrane protein